MVERRKDYDGRRRIEQLELRYHRVTYALIGGMAAQGAALIIGFLALGHQSASIQASRRVSIQRICEQHNADHRAIIGFVVAVAPDLKGRVAASFPVTKDCAAYARHLTTK